MQDILFSITCPYCKQKLKCPAKLVGAERSCPGCQGRFLIPFPEAIPLDQVEPKPDAACQDSNWEIVETENEIDDTLVRYATLYAIEEKAGLRPKLICRANLKKRCVTQEVFVSFPTKVFSIRDDLVPARVRVDSTEPLRIPLSTSETGNACFFQKPNELVTRLHGANTVLIELRLLRLGTMVFEFEISGFAQVHGRLLLGAVEARTEQLKDFNQEIVDHVLRVGPRNLDALIEVLCKSKLLGNHQVDEARRKSFQLFAAAQAFGELHHVGEIYGFAEGDRLNDMFALAVYDDLTAATRSSIGKLTIFD